MLEVEDYKPLTLADRERFLEHYLRFPVSHSEYLFTSLISWVHYTPAYFLFRGESLLLMNVVDGQKQFRPPIGERNDALLREVLELAKREGGQRPIVAVEEEARKWVGELFPEAKLTADRDFFDYVYSAKDLAELPGKNFLRQRNHLNKFRRQYKYSVEDVAAETMEEVSRFLKRWCLWRDCESSPMLEAEKKAILYCMEHFFELGLSGIVIRIGGEVQALSVYEPMNESTAAIHFEKAMPDFDGLYPAINNEAARLLAKRFQFIDRESDLGVAGLRTAKMRLHPHHMAEVYFLKKEDLP